MRCRLALFILFAICSGNHVAAQDLWFVKAEAPPGGDGLSWATAFNDLQLALAAARLEPPGEAQEIWVAKGTYRPDGGSGDRTSAFIVDRPMTILGGFAGTESTPSARYPSTPLPVLSGDLGAPALKADNALHVVIVRDGTAQTRLESLVIRDGNADDALVSFGRAGGGVLIETGSPTLDSCLIIGSVARDGGGVYAASGTPTLDACIVRQNVATTSGGGAYLADGGNIASTIFDSNTGPSGAGVFVCCGPGSVRESMFTSNFGTNGGGIFLGAGSGPVSRTVFLGNSATRGGGIYASRAGAMIASCKFASNGASEGGGVYFDLGGTLVNSLFTRNTATSFGGGIYARNNPAIVGCTIYSNGAGFTGGGLHHASGTTTLANSILWANTDSSGVGQQAQLVRVTGTLAPVACCVDGWTGSLGGSLNTGTAPQLFDVPGVDGLLGTADDDPRLTEGSICIDAGSNPLWPADEADLDQDGDTVEATPLDLNGTARALDDDAIPDVGIPGAGLTAIADIGASELIPGCVGDINADFMVNILDFNLLALNFGAANAAPSQGDINHDTNVNISDFNVLAANFGVQCQ